MKIGEGAEKRKNEKRKAQSLNLPFIPYVPYAA